MTDFPPISPLKPWAVERMEHDWPPTVEVVQVGRWSYRVQVVHGLFSPYDIVTGSKRARRKGCRMLAAYVAKCERERDWALNATTIEVPE